MLAVLANRGRGLLIFDFLFFGIKVWKLRIVVSVSSSYRLFVSIMLAFYRRSNGLSNGKSLVSQLLRIRDRKS